MVVIVVVVGVVAFVHLVDPLRPRCKMCSPNQARRVVEKSWLFTLLFISSSMGPYTLRILDTSSGLRCVIIRNSCRSV